MSVRLWERKRRVRVDWGYQVRGCVLIFSFKESRLQLPGKHCNTHTVLNEVHPSSVKADSTGLLSPVQIHSDYKNDQHPVIICEAEGIFFAFPLIVYRQRQTTDKAAAGVSKSLPCSLYFFAKKCKIQMIKCDSNTEKYKLCISPTPIKNISRLGGDLRWFACQTEIWSLTAVF